MRTTVLTLAAAIAALAAPARAGGPADPAPVIAAEHAFAARAAEVGVAPSFLEFMADEAMIFAPGPVSAKALYGSRPKSKTPKEGGTLLAWWPNFAGIARSGDLGFTTGPASINGKPPGVFYFTVWQKQPDGAWRWVFDGGVEADGAGAPGRDVPPATLPAGDPAPLSPANAWAQVAAQEAALAAAPDLAPRLAPEARVQAPKQPPATGEAARAALAARPQRLAYRLIGGGASSAGDLVWTWGEARGATGAAHFVRVWQRRGGGWRIVFDQLV